MLYCKHIQWLGLAITDGEIFLQCTDRLRTLVEDFPDQDAQDPSLLVFIGNRAKSLAMKELAKTFSPAPRYGKSGDDQERSIGGGATEKRVHGEIHLHIHTPTTFTNRPILLADGDFPVLERPRRALSPEKFHETTSTKLPNQGQNAHSLSCVAEKIYFKLLAPFTDVFCFFAADLGGLKPIAQHLAKWLDLGQSSTLSRSTRPRILIVTESSQRDEESLEVFYQMLATETRIDANEQFSEVLVISLLPRSDLSNKARHRKLKEHLFNASDQVREARVAARTLFSARHFSAFFDCAFHHLATTSKEPFNFITTSRIERVVPPDLEYHVVNFMSAVKIPEKLDNFAIPMIASSIILDSFPSRTHLFKPVDIFRTLYELTFTRACQRVTSNQAYITTLRARFVQMLEEEFLSQFELFKNSALTNIAWHRRTLSRSHLHWLHSYIGDEKTCFYCIADIPQYRLSCGHFICDTCVRRFGTVVDIWQVQISHCVPCGTDTQGFTMKMRPPTATARLLSIDGGGARGIIPLIFLQALEESIGLPIQDNFDVIVGTSSGGISVLALFVNGWSVENCIDQFERLAVLAFHQHTMSGLRWISQLRALIMSLVTDGIYPAQALERVLQEVFGSRGILDLSHATSVGAKIGITVSSMKPESFLLTNYNGVGDRDGRYGKYSVLPGNAMIWEVARATSAAPGIFTAKTISGLGKFQDGGLRYNNPTKIAIKEAAALSWVDRHAKSSALKVSLGTGKRKKGDKELQGSESWWEDMWLIRLCRAFWSSMDGQEVSDAIYRKKRKRFEDDPRDENIRNGEYFRFNLEFEGREPTLCDTSKMHEMKRMARESILQSEDLSRLSRCMIAENFVFELETMPRRKNGQYPCIGYILCRLRNGNSAYNTLLERLANVSATFKFRGRPLQGQISDRTSVGRDGNFRKRVCFNVDSKADLFSLRVQEGDMEPCDISGSPFSVTGL